MVAIASGSADKMKALVQDGSGSADVLHLREIDAPAVADDRVLVKVHAASVNAADYHVVHGALIVRVIGKLLRQARPSPIRGADVAGVVQAAGKNVTTLRPGDEVFGLGTGTWAEYATGTERSLLPKPAGLSFVEAGAIGVAALTALQGLRDHGRMRAGHRVLIYGAGGGVGTFAVQIAKALGANVTAVTGTRGMDIVRPLGADELVDYTNEDVAKRQERYDVIFDVAATRSLRDLRRMLVPGGTLVCAGAAKRGGWLGILVRLLAIMFRSRVLRQRVVFYVASTRREDLVYLKELVEAGRLRPVIERIYPLGEAREAVRYAMSGQARAKVVITMN
ncbi:MAG TPA: NAD(P)-dependent alcohol dehydrogenase [Vicinamibacterales bacterium]|jgi:NADPH:quinone reductase-like Zn-dependent oxidoreductase|nr:NAD(P)-dependent alcohol dehydrogenase [Vicinamibacterales bacterium]